MAGYLLVYVPPPSPPLMSSVSAQECLFFFSWNLHMQDVIAESATLLLTEYNVRLLPVFYPPLRAIYQHKMKTIIHIC